MSDQPITDDEVLGIMIDGGVKLCDYAIEKWISDGYGMSHEVKQQYIRRWRAIQQRVREIGKETRRQLKEDSDES